MNKQSPLDRGLHNSLYEFKAPVNDAHWDKIESILDKKSNKKVFHLWMLIPFLVVGTACGIYLFRDSANKVQNATLTNEKIDAVNAGNKPVNANHHNTLPNTEKEYLQIQPEQKEAAKTIEIVEPVLLSHSLPAKIDEVKAPVFIVEEKPEFKLFNRAAIKFNYSIGNMFLSVIPSAKFDFELKPLKPRQRQSIEIGVMPMVGFYAVNYIGMHLPEGYRHSPAFSDGLLTAVSSADVQGANYGISFFGRKYLNNKIYLSSGLALNMSQQQIHYVISSNLKGYNIKDGYLNYTNLEIPVGIGYRLTSSTSKTRFFIEPGINVVAFSHTRANLFNLETELQENVNMNTPLINPKLGLNFSYPVAPRLTINGVYQVRYLQYKTNSSYHYKIAGTQHQLGVGLSMKF